MARVRALGGDCGSISCYVRAGGVLGRYPASGDGGHRFSGVVVDGWCDRGVTPAGGRQSVLFCGQEDRLGGEPVIAEQDERLARVIREIGERIDFRAVRERRDLVSTGNDREDTSTHLSRPAVARDLQFRRRDPRPRWGCSRVADVVGAQVGSPR
jgi:hypothetical protein